MRAALGFQQEFKVGERLELVLDDMKDSFTKTLAAHPLNWYVIEGISMKLQYIAEPVEREQPFLSHRGEYRGYDFEKLVTFLNCSKG